MTGISSANVPDTELLARAIFSPYHINKKGKLKSAAFKAPPGRREVSVNRTSILDENACKQYAKKIASPGCYQGFAILLTKIIREAGSDVIDSREHYLGHADVIHSFVLEKNKPAPPEINHRLKHLAECANFHSDSTPDLERWTGDKFCDSYHFAELDSNTS